MLTIISQPGVICALPKSRPIVWLIQTDDHVVNPGARPLVEIAVSAGAGAGAGTAFTLGGVDYTVLDGATEPFNDTGFAIGADAAATAANLAGMFRSSYRWADYRVFVTDNGDGSWLVQVEGNRWEPEPDERWVFSFGLGGFTLAEANGQAVLLKNMRLWYQVYQEEEQLTERRFLHLPYDPNLPASSGVVSIDIQNQAKAILQTTPPDIQGTASVADPAFYRRVHIRFGLVELGENCAAVYYRTYQSADVGIINSVYQPEEGGLIPTACPSVNRKVAWLSTRPLTNTICEEEHEWIHVILRKRPFYTDQFTIRYRFFNAAGAEVSVYDEPVTIGAEPQARMVHVGTANLKERGVWPAGSIVRYTVQVLQLGMGGILGATYDEYTEAMVRTIGGCGCKAAEVYYLGDRGSWETVIFEWMEEVNMEMAGVTYNRSVDWSVQNTSFLLTEGGGYSAAVGVDRVYTLTTERLVGAERAAYEALLRSPIHFIKVGYGANETLRRILIDRKGYRTFIRKGVTRLQIPFRFNMPIFYHD